MEASWISRIAGEDEAKRSCKGSRGVFKQLRMAVTETRQIDVKAGAGRVFEESRVRQILVDDLDIDDVV
jgi:hypothetical protein